MVKLPLISVIIPTRNRSSLLAQTLESIYQQTFPKEDYEAIVVDNGSIDNTAEIIEHFKQRPDFNLRAMSEDSLGLMFARHAGARAATSAILLYTDDDVIADPNWVESIFNCFSDQDTAAAGGRVIPRFEAAVPEWFYQFGDEENCGALSLVNLGPGISLLNPTKYLYGCNFAIRKTVLFQVGGFNPDGFPSHLLKYRGDGECGLIDKLRQRALKIKYDSEAIVYHLIPESRLQKEYFLNRAHREGFSKAFSVLRRANSQKRELALVYDAARSLIEILLLKIIKPLVRDENKKFRLDFLTVYLISRARQTVRFLLDKQLRTFALLEDYINSDYTIN